MTCIDNVVMRRMEVFIPSAVGDVVCLESTKPSRIFQDEPATASKVMMLRYLPVLPGENGCALSWHIPLLFGPPDFCSLVDYQPGGGGGGGCMHRHRPHSSKRPEKRHRGWHRPSASLAIPSRGYFYLLPGADDDRI